MNLTEHIRKLIAVYGYKETIIARPQEVREILFYYKITPSLNQVKCAINRDLHYILYGTKPVTKSSNFHPCDCGNPAPHITDACQQALALEKAGVIPNYHCVICQMYGDNHYADPHGIVWVNGSAACELNRQILKRTEHQDRQMRRDMTYAFGAAIST